MHYRVLIVDDNHMQIQSVLTYVDWSKFHIDEIEVAHDGTEGIEVFEHFRPHIVISDVVMQEMDGLEMTREIKRRDDTVKFIFMSCYENFDFLKGAMENEAISYILKPVTKEKLEEVILKTTEKLAFEERMDNISNLLKESMDVYRKNFFTRMIYTKHLDREYVEATVKNLHLDQYQAFVFAKVDMICVRAIDIYNLLKLTEGRMFLEVAGMLIVENEGRMAAMFMSDTDDGEVFKSRVEHSLEKYRNEVNKEYRVNLNIGLSEVHRSLTEAAAMIEESLAALENNLSFDTDGIHIYNDIIYENSTYNLVEMKEALTNLIYDCRPERIMSFIRQFSGSAQMSTYSFRTLCIHIFTLLQLILNERNMFNDDTLVMLSEIWNKINRIHNPEGAERWISDTLYNIIHLIYKRSVEGGEKLVQDIDGMIEKYYRSLNNIGEIAYELFVSESYARKLYKQYTGRTIFEKLFVTRMENAKRLLSIPGVTVQSVAEQVGYKSKPAFVNAFKRYTGKLPSEFLTGSHGLR